MLSKKFVYQIKNGKLPKGRTAYKLWSLKVWVRLLSGGNFEKFFGGMGILDLKKSVRLDIGNGLKEVFKGEQHEYYTVHRIDMVEQRALSWCFCCNCLSPTKEQSFWDSKRKLASEEFSINILWNNYQEWFVYIVKVLWKSLGASYGCECCFSVTVLSLKLKQTGDCWNCGGLERILYQYKFQEEVTLMLTAFSSRALENSELLTYL